MNPWLSILDDDAEVRRAAGLRRELRPRAAGDATVDLAGNDYLGLARHPEVIAAAAQALAEFGLGATGSRLVRGCTDIHLVLEEALARHLACETALVFSSGYLANLGALRALVRPGSVVISVTAPSADAAFAWAAACRERGVAVGCFRPLSTPDGRSRLRLTVNAGIPARTFDDALDTVVKTAP